MGKIKKENLDDSQVNGQENGEGLSYEEKLNFTTIISQPMASKKTCGRIYKLLRKSSQINKTSTKSFFMGLKNVMKAIRKGSTGIVIIGGDVNPIDLIVHLPGVCEEKGLPYIFVPSRKDIGTAMNRNGSPLIALVGENSDYKEYYDKVLEDIKKSATKVEVKQE